MAGKKRPADNKEMENQGKKYTKGYSQEYEEWKLVEKKKKAKEKRAKIQDEVATMKVGNKEEENNQSKKDDVNMEDSMHKSREVTTEDSRYDTAKEMEVDTESTHVNPVEVRTDNTEVNNGREWQKVVRERYRR